MNKVLQKIKNNPLIQSILPLLTTQTYVVGGFVRDCYFSKTSFDIDLVVENHQAETFARKLAAHFKAHFIKLDEEHGIYRVVMPDKLYYFDVADAVGETIENDLQSRDLTINALAVKLNDFTLIDFTGGEADLKNSVIRSIKNENFASDPLRALRVFRFSSVLGFDVEQSTLTLAEEYAGMLDSCAKERQKQELLKLFNGKYAHKALLEMDKAGLLDIVFPDFSPVKSIPSNSHHHLDLFHHCVETVKQVQGIYDNASLKVREHLEEPSVEGVPRLAVLKLSAFLHDIGKPETWTIESDTGRHRFIKHDVLGAEKIVPLLKSLKCAKKHITYVQNMVRNHIYPSTLFNGNESTDKAKMRFVRKMKEDSIDIIVLAMADRLSARGVAVTVDMVENNLSNLNGLMDFYFNNKYLLEPLPKLIDGNEIMKMFGLSPSKKLGNILDALRQAQLDGDVQSKEGAVAFIKQQL